MSYRVGLPFWKSVARAGGEVKLRIELLRDEEAGVYVGVSPDLDGLVVEAATLDELRHEALAAASYLLEKAVHSSRPPRSKADFHFRAALPCAA